MEQHDDQFLEAYRREPRAGFVGDLRRRLNDQDEPARGFVWRPVLAGATALATVIALFAFPSVRAFGQSVLDLFRVHNFVAVSFDPDRLEKLRALKNDNAMLIFEHQETVQDPGKPTVQPSVSMAAAAAGFSVTSPGYLPGNLAPDTVTVTREGRMRFELTSRRLREVLSTLEVRDVNVPANIDGQRMDVHLYPVVEQRFRSGSLHLELVQSRSPEVSLPNGVDLAQLGEIGLRILGLDASEARRMAGAIDWKTTLIVPVPANASSFRQVTVHGSPGLLVTVAPRDAAAGRPRRGGGTALMWTEGDKVYALDGTLSSEDMMQVAESVH